MVFLPGIMESGRRRALEKGSTEECSGVWRWRGLCGEPEHEIEVQMDGETRQMELVDDWFKLNWNAWFSWFFFVDGPERRDEERRRSLLQLGDSVSIVLPF